MTTNFPGEILRDVNEKLLIASVQQHELAEIARQAELRLSALVNGLDVIICEIDVRTGEIIFLSEQAESILGYDRAKLHRRGFWRRIIHSDDRHDVLSTFYDAIGKRQDQEQEFRVIAADGRILWIHTRGVVGTGADKTANLMRCVIEDVSNRKDAEKLIAHSERRFRRLFEAARDGILLLNAQTGVITDANPFVAELLGFAHDALIGREFFEIGLFADKKKSRDAFSRIQTERSVRYDNLIAQSPTGIMRTVDLVGSIYAENGHTVVQCQIRDVTERRRAETEQAGALLRELRITEFLQRPLKTNFTEDEFPGVALTALYEPALAEAEVGGDYFDVFAVDESAGSHRVMLCVGDVVGKGLQAASLAVRLKEVLHAFASENPDPAQTLFRLNNYLCTMVSGDKATDFPILSLSALSLATLDSRTGRVIISTAGAEPVTILRAGGQADVISATGLTLGVERDEPFVNASNILGFGDTLLMTTDGLTEARRGMAFLGYEGLVDIALENRDAPSISEMGQAIVSGARAYGGGFRDDVCLLLARLSK